MKKDLTMCSDNELSTIIFTSKDLYKFRHSTVIKILVEDRYEFTDRQWQVFKNDLKYDVVK